MEKNIIKVNYFFSLFKELFVSPKTIESFGNNIISNIFFKLNDRKK